MEALFYLFSVAERAPQHPDGSGRSAFNGYLVVGLLAMAVLSSMLRLFETHIYDIGGTLAGCCAFGPVNPKNPLSSKAIAFTYIVLPIALVMTIAFRGAVKRHLLRIEEGYRVSKAACLLFVFAVVMLAPLGAQGGGLQPLAVLAGQGVLYAAFALWVRFQAVRRVGLTDRDSNTSS